MGTVRDGIDRHPLPAGAACVAAIVAVTAWAHFPSGYSSDQWALAEHLRALSRDRVLDLRAAAGRDLVYAATYGLAGAGLARALFSLANPRARRRQLGKSVAPALVIVMAAADLAETVLFRASLDRVKDGRDPGSLPWATRAFTCLKMGSLVAALAVLAWTAVRTRTAWGRRLGAHSSADG
jgi:hypothetical protein